MSGHNSMKMADLSLMYKQLGFNENKTYIQSGNVIFKTDHNNSAASISLRIEEAIFEKFGHNVPVIIRSTSELRGLLSVNPYIKSDQFDPSKMAVIFLTGKVTETQMDKMRSISYPPDEFMIADREIFIYCPNGFGKTKLYTNFFENKMAVTGTARNWKTITTILAMAEEF